MIEITGLFIYPVKSLGGISLREAELGARGLMFDREWVIVDTNNRFISQREIPRMSLIQTAIDQANGSLILRLPNTSDNNTTTATTTVPSTSTIRNRGRSDGNNYQELSIPLDQSEKFETIKVTVWSDSAQATMENTETNTALSKYLGQEVRLVRMAPGYKRRVDGRYAPAKENIVGFADGFPLLIISEESLEDLNDRLEYPVLMNRFRPNITARGGGAFAEDTWAKVKVSSIEMDLVKPCARCVITTIDQDSGVQGKEPLRTLANFRKNNGKILFGQNAIFKGPGKLVVGDQVFVLDLHTS
jgi:uncharacterized protein YcbX